MLAWGPFTCDYVISQSGGRRLCVWGVRRKHYGIPSGDPVNTKGVRTLSFSSPAPVLIQEAGILIRILFATQVWNPNPEKILLTCLTNQCATIKNFCFQKVCSDHRSVSGSSYFKSYSSVTCNVTVKPDECVAECTRFGINVLNPSPNP